MEVKTSTHHIRAPRSRTAKFDAQGSWSHTTWILSVLYCTWLILHIFMFISSLGNTSKNFCVEGPPSISLTHALN